MPLGGQEPSSAAARSLPNHSTPNPTPACPSKPGPVLEKPNSGLQPACGFPSRGLTGPFSPQWRKQDKKSPGRGVRSRDFFGFCDGLIHWRGGRDTCWHPNLEGPPQPRGPHWAGGGVDWAMVPQAMPSGWTGRAGSLESRLSLRAALYWSSWELTSGLQAVNLLMTFWGPWERSRPCPGGRGGHRHTAWDWG